MENATYQEGCPPASPVFGMPMPGGATAGYSPGAEQGGQAAAYAGYPDPGAPVGPLGAPMQGQALTAAAAEPCAEPSVEAEAPGKPGTVTGAQYAAPQGPQYAPQYAPQYGPQYAAPQGPQNARQPGAQYAPQGPQGAQYAPQGPQGAQYAPPQSPQYAPQYGPGPEDAQNEHEEGEGKKGHCHGHGGHAEQAQEPQAGFFGFPGFGGLGGFAGAPGSPSEDPKHLEYRYGQMIELCNDIMQGKADPSKIAAFLTSTGAHFWKGAIVGAAVTFLLTNSAVKSAMGDTFSAIFGAAKGGE